MLLNCVRIEVLLHLLEEAQVLGVLRRLLPRLLLGLRILVVGEVERDDVEARYGLRRRRGLLEDDVLHAEVDELLLAHLAQRLGQNGAGLDQDMASQRLEIGEQIGANLALAVAVHETLVSLAVVLGKLKVLLAADRVLVCERDGESGHGVCR